VAVRIQRRIPAASRQPSTPGRPPSAGTRAGGASTRRMRRRVPLKHLVRFTRLLATLTEAGLPVLRNLRILSNQWPSGRFRDSILDAADMVEEGNPLSDAFAHHPEVFDELYINMARAGEAGGVLDQVLARLADFLERSQGLRDRTRGALAYPLVVFLVAVLVISILTIFVIPKFSALFTDMDLEIPLATRILMDVSAFMQHWWFLVLGLPVLFGVLYQTLYLRAFGFRRWNHRTILRLPLLGSLVRTAQIARFSATFGTLVASGVPHLRGFEITRGALSNELYREAMEDVREQVREGESIAASLAATERFDDVVVSMVEVGEQTGALDNMCLRLGANYEQNYNRSLDVLLRLLEPFMLIVMAVLVGTIALAMFLPLFKLIEQFGKPV